MLVSRDAATPTYAGERDARFIMRQALAKEVGALAESGWSIKSQSATTAELETREPFNWWLVYAGSLMLLGLGGLIYAASWLISSRVRLFLHEREDGSVTMSGDTQFASWQRLDLADPDAGGSLQNGARLTANQVFVGLSASLGVMLLNAAIWFFLVLGVLAAVD